mmetsp:Transcript_37323/g.117361  ORF Transcript_37323/g.117361 Transcript_37323/m.117361 type:complete len:459 (+) Transcript_37323:394-1770(+)
MHLRAHRRVQGRLCARVPDAIDAVGGDGVLRGRLDPRRDAQGGARLRRAVRRRHLPRRPARARVHARRAQGDPPRHQGGERAAQRARGGQARRPRHCRAAAKHHVEEGDDDWHSALDGARGAQSCGRHLRGGLRHRGRRVVARHHRHRAQRARPALLRRLLGLWSHAAHCAGPARNAGAADGGVEADARLHRRRARQGPRLATGRLRPPLAPVCSAVHRLRALCDGARAAGGQEAGGGRGGGCGPGDVAGPSRARGEFAAGARSGGQGRARGGGLPRVDPPRPGVRRRSLRQGVGGAAHAALAASWAGRGAGRWAGSEPLEPLQHRGVGLPGGLPGGREGARRAVGSPAAAVAVADAARVWPDSAPQPRLLGRRQGGVEGDHPTGGHSAGGRGAGGGGSRRGGREGAFGRPLVAGGQLGGPVARLVEPKRLVLPVSSAAGAEGAARVPGVCGAERRLF